MVALCLCIKKNHGQTFPMQIHSRASSHYEYSVLCWIAKPSLFSWGNYVHGVKIQGAYIRCTRVELGTLQTFHANQ